MKTMAAKVIPVLVYAFVFSWLTTGAHEQFHYLMATGLGIDSHATFSWWGGAVYLDQEVSAGQYVLFRMAGGLGVAALFGLLWLMAHWQGHYSDWEVDDTMIFAMVCINQLVYGVFEGLEYWIGWSVIVGGILSIAILFPLYSRKIFRWLQSKQ